MINLFVFRVVLSPENLKTGNFKLQSLFNFNDANVDNEFGNYILIASFPTRVVTLTQVGTSVYLGQTHLGTPLQLLAWVRKFSLGSTGDEISSLIIICTAEV